VSDKLAEQLLTERARARTQLLMVSDERDELRELVERLTREQEASASLARLYGQQKDRAQAEVERLKVLIVGLLHADEDAFEQARTLTESAGRSRK